MSLPMRTLIALNIFLLVALTALAIVAFAPKADAAKATYNTVTIKYVAAKVPGLSDSASCGQATTKQTGWRNATSYREDFQEGPFTNLIICEATLRVVP